MIAITFDNRYFCSLEALAAYIQVEYGSWAQVPADHPQYGVIKALIVLNSSYYLDVDGEARSIFPLPCVQ